MVISLVNQDRKRSYTVAKANDDEFCFRHAETGKVQMLNKKERILIKALLGGLMSSKRGKELIREKFGEEYVEVALRLLRVMSGSSNASDVGSGL